MAGSKDYRILKTTGGSTKLFDGDVGASGGTFTISVTSFEQIWLCVRYTAGLGGGTGTATQITLKPSIEWDVSSAFLKGFEPFGADRSFPWPEESVSAPDVTVGERRYILPIDSANNSQSLETIIIPVNYFPLPLKFTIAATGGASGEEGVTIAGFGV